MIERLAAVLRQKKAVQTLLPEILAEVTRLVPVDAMRLDLDENGRLWSRLVKPGAEPERPGLLAVPRIASRETESSREVEGLHELTLLLGIGEVSGRFILRRSRPFDEAEKRTLRIVSDLLTLGLRARPFDPPARARHPFEEGPLV